MSIAQRIAELYATKMNAVLDRCRFSFTMSLSHITCRLNVACDIFVRK
jgi:hypothetical protein